MESKNYLMDFAQIKEASAKNLMKIDNVKFDNILAFKSLGSMGSGKTTFYNMLKSIAGAKFIEKPLTNGKESGSFEGEILRSNGENWTVKYEFDKKNNFPVLKTFLKNGKKATKKDFAEMIREVEPKVNFDVSEALKLSGKKQFEYFAKHFEIDIKKEEIEYNNNFEIRAGFNSEMKVFDARYLRTNLPDYDKKKVDLLKEKIKNLEIEIQTIKEKGLLIDAEKKELTFSIESDLMKQSVNLENELTNLQKDRQLFNEKIENKESTKRILIAAKEEIEKQFEIIKNYIPEFKIEANFNFESFNQGEKVPVKSDEISNFTKELFNKLPKIMQDNLLERKKFLKEYQKIKAILKSKDYDVEKLHLLQIKRLDNNKLLEKSTTFLNDLNKKVEVLDKLKPEHDKFLEDQQNKIAYENSLSKWQEQDNLTQKSLQKVINKLNSFEFADPKLKFNGFVNDRGHLEIILNYDNLELSAKSEGEKAIIGAYLQASLIKKGQLGLVYIPAKYMSKKQVDELVSYLVLKGMQPYLEFTEFANDKKLSIDHYTGFEYQEEKDF